MCIGVIILFLVANVSACSSSPKQSPDVRDSIRTSLNQAGLNDVSVSQDRDKGVVTLDGHVAAESDKAKAESLAKGLAGGQVVANQILVTPPAAESDAKAINSDHDKAIEKNLDAELIKSNLQKVVKFDVKNGVVTLTGNANSPAIRSDAEKVAASVPNVVQVVNEMDVKNSKATTTK